MNEFKDLRLALTLSAEFRTDLNRVPIRNSVSVIIPEEGRIIRLWLFGEYNYLIGELR
jgi:hypothetical protein